MKKKVILGTLIIGIVLLLLPIPIKLKDGGTIEWTSLRNSYYGRLDKSI